MPTARYAFTQCAVEIRPSTQATSVTIIFQIGITTHTQLIHLVNLWQPIRVIAN
jgi:hypothetical protein